MNTYKFKTNINCSGCVAAVTPALDGNKDIKEWNADTANPNKILTVQTETLTAEQVKEIVTKAGYKAEVLA
jgi:copper chaperone